MEGLKYHHNDPKDLQAEANAVLGTILKQERPIWQSVKGEKEQRGEIKVKVIDDQCFVSSYNHTVKFGKRKGAFIFNLGDSICSVDTIYHAIKIANFLNKMKSINGNKKGVYEKTFLGGIEFNSENPKQSTTMLYDGGFKDIFGSNISIDLAVNLLTYYHTINDLKGELQELQKYAGGPTIHRSAEEYNNRHAKLMQAKKEMSDKGIPDFQKKAAYVKGKSERAFYNITPQGYGDLAWNLERYKRYKNNLGRDKNELVWYRKGEELEDGKKAKKNIFYSIPKRDDAFLLYLGIPQKNNSFGISDYQPANSKNKDQIYFKPNYVSSAMKQRLINEFFDKKKMEEFDQAEKLKGNELTKFIMNERGTTFEQKLDSLKKAGIPWNNPETPKWFLDNPLGDFTVSMGKDNRGYYISIYDIWDLNPFQSGKGSSSNKEAAPSLISYLLLKGYNVNGETEVSSIFGAGHPFEIYDRIYYDPKTKKLIK